MKKTIVLVVCCGALLYLAGAVESHSKAQFTASGSVDFIRDIQPILRQNCYPCHGAGKASGQLRLHSKSTAFQGGVSGSVINPGNSKQSLLIQRLQGQKDMPRMPLAGEPLSSQQIALISAWIDQGARWPDEPSAADAGIQKHWAYTKPVQPQPPEVKKASWIRNQIDNFVLARLEKEGLAPSQEAPKETLIRRLSLDLTGLPPGLDEIDRFLADRDPNAYEKVVDRLLGSPHYGERWARPGVKNDSRMTAPRSSTPPRAVRRR